MTARDLRQKIYLQHDKTCNLGSELLCGGWVQHPKISDGQHCTCHCKVQYHLALDASLIRTCSKRNSVSNYLMKSEFTIKRKHQHEPQYAMILVMRTPKKRIFGHHDINIVNYEVQFLLFQTACRQFTDLSALGFGCTSTSLMLPTMILVTSVFPSLAWRKLCGILGK